MTKVGGLEDKGWTLFRYRETEALRLESCRKVPDSKEEGLKECRLGELEAGWALLQAWPTLESFHQTISMHTLNRNIHIISYQIRSDQIRSDHIISYHIISYHIMCIYIYIYTEI